MTSNSIQPMKIVVYLFDFHSLDVWRDHIWSFSSFPHLIPYLVIFIIPSFNSVIFIIQIMYL